MMIRILVFDLIDHDLLSLELFDSSDGAPFLVVSTSTLFCAIRSKTIVGAVIALLSLLEAK